MTSALLLPGPFLRVVREILTFNGNAASARLSTEQWGKAKAYNSGTPWKT